MTFISYHIILSNIMKKSNKINYLQILSIEVKFIKQRWLHQVWASNNHQKFKSTLNPLKIKQI